jgi:MFS transporter, Spinster family, sphingosine-1-phosphate transporter
MTKERTGELSPWSVVALLTAIAALNYADRSALSAVLALVRDDLQLSPFVVGAVGSAFIWVYAICSPVSGYLADRWRRSRVIVLSLVAWSVVTMATGLVGNSTELLIVRGLLGLAECAYVPAAIGLTAEYHPGKTRARAIGIQLAGFNMGVVLGGVFAGYIGDHWGWRPAFWVLGAAGFVMAAVTHKVLPRVGPEEHHTVRSAPISPAGAARELLSVPTFVIVLLESSCVAMSVWVFLVWLPLYFKEAFDLSLTQAGLAGTVGLQIAATTASVAGGFLSDRFAGTRGERRMLFQFICFMSAIPLLIPFTLNPSFGAASLAIFLFAFFRSLGSSTDNAILCDVLPSRVHSTAVGVTNAANSTAGAVAVMLTGYLKADFGLAGVFVGLCGTVAIAACLVLIGYRYYLARDLARTSAPVIRQATPA